MSYQICYPGKMPGESQALERTVVFLLVLTLTLAAGIRIFLPEQAAAWVRGLPSWTWSGHAAP